MNRFELSLIGVIVVLVIFIGITNFAESKELTCLRLYHDIKELSSTPEMQFAEQEAMQQAKNMIFEYVETDCPDFQNLELIYNNYKQNFP
ncbi:MAG: hypothetical protein ACREAJ_01670 [Nitrosopumilaceae archaeon]